MKKVIKNWLLGSVSLLLCIALSIVFTSAKSDTFVYNGNNMSSYKGQTVLVIDVKNITAKDTRKIYKYKKKLSKVKTIKYSDKVRKVLHDPNKSLYDACPNVTKLVFGKNIKWEYYDEDLIAEVDGHHTFEVMKKLKKLDTIKVDKKNKNYYTQNGILCYKNKKYTSIRYWYSTKNVEKLVIPDGIKNVNTDVFDGKTDKVKTLVCSKELQNITFRDGINGNDALQNFPKLESIVIPEENKNIIVQDGCLYQKNEDTSSKISYYVMAGYIAKSGIVDIHVPDSVRNFDTDWLKNYADLKITLHLPASVVNYSDTTEQVVSLTIDANNSVYYSDGKKAQKK